MSTKVGCHQIERSRERAWAYFRTYDTGELLAFAGKRKAIFEKYRGQFAEGVPDPLIYDETEDLVATAKLCAETIVANECPVYALAERTDGVTRVVLRETVERYPHRYTIITN